MSHRHETHVVIIVRVSRDAISESGVGGACPLRSAEHSTVTVAFCNDGSANDLHCSLGSSGENDADCIA